MEGGGDERWVEGWLLVVDVGWGEGGNEGDEKGEEGEVGEGVEGGHGDLGVDEIRCWFGLQAVVVD